MPIIAKVCALALATLSLGSAPPPLDMRTINDDLPPPRFQGDATVTLSVGTLSECGDPPKGYFFRGCVRDRVIHMPNPCTVTGEQFAKILCHEIAHSAHDWPATHGD